MTFIIFATVILVLMMLLPRPWRAVVLLVVALLPFSVGDAGGAVELRISEWLPAFLAPLVLADMLYTKRTAVPRRGGWLLLIAIAFGIVAGANMARYSGEAMDYTRAYWSIFVGVLLVIEISWYGRWLVEQPRAIKQMLQILLWLSVGLCAARIANYYLGTPLPFLVGLFRYSGQLNVGGVIADRIGGLTESVTLGVASLCALASIGWNRRTGVALAVYFAAIVLVSGGRTYALTMLVVIGVFIMASAGRRGRAVAGVAVIGLVAFIALQVTMPTSQIERITNVSTSVQTIDPFRYGVVTAELREFKLHPVFGKGIGTVPSQPYDVNTAMSVRMGGHSSYASVLANFGILGGLLMIAMLTAPLVVGAQTIRRHFELTPVTSGIRAMGMFVLIVAIIHIGDAFTGGNGYGDPAVYALLGLAAALADVAYRQVPEE